METYSKFAEITGFGYFHEVFDLGVPEFVRKPPDSFPELDSEGTFRRLSLESVLTESMKMSFRDGRSVMAGTR